MKYLLVIILSICSCSTFKNVTHTKTSKSGDDKIRLYLFNDGNYRLQYARLRTNNFSPYSFHPTEYSLGWYIEEPTKIIELYPRINRNYHPCLFIIRTKSKTDSSSKFMQSLANERLHPYWIYINEQSYLINSSSDLQKIKFNHNDHLFFLKNNTRITEIVYDSTLIYSIQYGCVPQRNLQLYPHIKECQLFEDRVIMEFNGKLKVLYQINNKDSVAYREYSE